MRTLAVILLLAAGIMQGCAGAAAAPVLTAVSAGAEAGKQGYTFLDSGRLNFTVEGSFSTTEHAIRGTIERLDLTVRWEEAAKENAPPKIKWSVRSDHAHLVILEIQHVTDALTRVQVRAGALGDKATAHVIAATIREELIKPE